MEDKLENQVEAHEQKHTITEFVEYPTHLHRSESAEYKRNHHILVFEENRPCFVCDLLNLPKHPMPLETHHFVVEWAEWGNADPNKVQKLFDDGVIDFYKYSLKLNGKPVESPDDIRNLQVLCATHHRGKGDGIHETTSPSFFSQMVAKDGIEVLKGSLKR